MKLKKQFYIAIKRKNYSKNTGDAYWTWIEGFIRFNGVKHPSELTDKVNDYLTHLTIVKNLAPKSIRLAGCALIFL